MSDRIHYLVDVVFNNRGIKLTGRKIHSLAVYSEPENLEFVIHEIVPPQLISSYSLRHDTRALMIGSLCVIYNEENRLKYYGIIIEDSDESSKPSNGLVAYVFRLHDIIRFKRESGVGSYYKVKYKIREIESDEEDKECEEEHKVERERLMEEIIKDLKSKKLSQFLKIKKILK